MTEWLRHQLNYMQIICGLFPDKTSHQHPAMQFLQAKCSSKNPTDRVKTLTEQVKEILSVPTNVATFCFSS